MPVCPQAWQQLKPLWYRNRGLTADRNLDYPHTSLVVMDESTRMLAWLQSTVSWKASYTCQWHSSRLRQSPALHQEQQLTLDDYRGSSSGAGSKLRLVWRVSPPKSLSSLPFSLPSFPFFLPFPRSSLPFPPFFPLSTLTPPLPCTPLFPLEVQPLKSSWGYGERCELPQRGLGHPQPKSILVHFSL